MAKTDDLKAYAQELFEKAGLADKAKSFIDSLGDESVQKVLRDGFVATPQHHSTVDRIKSEIQAEAARAKAEADQVREWYNRDAKPAFDRATQMQNTLAQYESIYGPIQNAQDARQAAQVTGINEDAVRKMLADELGKRDQAYVGLTKAVSKATSDYVTRFKEPLDVDAVEKIALERGLSFDTAYKEFITPKLEAQRSAEVEAQLKAAREEGYRDAMSKHKIPVESAPREQHPFFDRKEVSAEVSERQQENMSKQAFLEAWNGYEQKAS